MMTIGEVSRATGVSVRTLHHYDAIGLLKPSCTTDAGYRCYDEAALLRLQQILLYRELRFSLAESQTILDSPHYDPQEALRQQIELLTMQRDQLDRLIGFAHDMLERGEINMKNMPENLFDKTEQDAYRQEVVARWGGTEAWREYARRSETRPTTPQDGAALMQLFAGLGSLRSLPPEDERVQAQVAAIQRFITEHWYTCTDEILASLGEMYTQDERFRRNIDKVGGEGTAAFAARAIVCCCAKK